MARPAVNVISKWESVATRFYPWQKADICKQALEGLQADAD
jgi:hypothetical protein